jgi:FMN-dependent NADH-azoreductase
MASDQDTGKIQEVGAQVPCLKQIPGFIGITDMSVVYAGGLASSDEARQSSLDKAFAEVEERASK